MRQKLTPDPWKIVQDSFSREDQRFFESLTSLGNGAMGLRGTFEEDYSGDTLRGTYIGGVWFPDRTRVGWWKNGYPEYFGKQINAMDLIGLSVSVNGETLDAGAMEVVDFRRELDMREGVLRRGMTLITASGEVTIRAERFVSMDDTPLLCLRYRVTPSFPARVAVTAYLDGEVRNEDSNYDERFWEGLESGARGDEACAHLVSRTKENPFGTPRFTVAGAFRAGGNMAATGSGARTGYAFVTLEKEVAAGETALVDKLICVATDRDHPAESLSDIAQAGAARARDSGYEVLLENHVRAWARKWEHADVRIEGDDAAQQGIRFSLFHLLCTYTGDDPRLNIGPKGFTGEKYGGATYWDTEAFCFPVYMAISGEDTARQLLLYRHRQLPGAYENARRLGLPGALYPMVTFDGTECHNEWEITFMELHRNGAIAHAIFNYVTYSGDEAYLVNKGLDVLCGIARFWAGRVHFHAGLGKYMLHGVTGPNEYENNVNNNWYTNRIAAWCLDFFREACGKAPPGRLADLGVTAEELARMGDVSARMYYPEDTERMIFIQHDTFLDKPLLPASAIPEGERPISHHWSWDRILRSCYIKQADVLQGLYFLGHLYGTDVKRRNFLFYEPMTVHESSLSPSVHAVLAAEIGEREKAAELYHRTARLDLDDINHDTRDGLHITSMAGPWLAIAQGFAGMRTARGLSFSPFVPQGWEGYAFRFRYRGRLVRLEVRKDEARFSLLEGEPLRLTVWGGEQTLEGELALRRDMA